MKAKREQTLVVGVVVLGVVILYVYLTALVAPWWRQFVQLGQEVASAEVKWQQTQQMVKQEPQLREERQRLSATIEGLGRSLPSEDALPKVIELLSKEADLAGVRIQTIFPQRSFENVTASTAPKAGTEDLSTLYKEIPIQIDAISGFHQLGIFLSRVESDAQAIEVKSLRISGNPKEPRLHDVKLVLRVYFSSAKAQYSSANQPSNE